MLHNIYIYKLRVYINIYNWCNKCIPFYEILTQQILLLMLIDRYLDIFAGYINNTFYFGIYIIS